MREDGRDNLSFMTYTLKSGIKETVPIGPSQIDNWIESFKNRTPYVIRNGDELTGLNPSEIASFKVHSKYSTYFNMMEPVRKEAVSINSPKETEQIYDNVALAEAYKKREIYNTEEESKIEPELFLLDCKCGCYKSIVFNRYLCKIKCKFCQEYNYRDVTKGKVSCVAGEAYLLTNKYYVDKQKAFDHINFLKEQEKINQL